MFPWGVSTEASGTEAHTSGSMSNKLCRLKFRILPPNLNNNGGDWPISSYDRLNHSSIGRGLNTRPGSLCL